MALIEFIDAGFSYPEGIKVFEGLNFALQEGERIGIIGANGSGKTTLFYLIMGLLKLEGGELKIFGRARSQEGDFKEVRRRIGFLFQDPDDQLFSPTVEEDVGFGPFNLGKNIDEVEKIVDKSLRTLGVLHLRKRVTFRLSWGQKKLVALAGILAMDPEILILDEPTAGLDKDIAEKLADYIISCQMPLLAASHDQDFLNRACNKIYCLEQGHLIPV